MELAMCRFSRRFLRVQNLDPNGKLQHVKTITLTLDNYQDMLKTKSQGKEGVSS
jgi:hypothetical protein